MPTPPHSSDDDVFAALTSGLDIDDNPDVADVTTMTQLELLETFQAARHQLSELRESFGQRTAAGAEADSRYQAVVAEMKRRGLM